MYVRLKRLCDGSFICHRVADGGRSWCVRHCRSVRFSFVVDWVSSGVRSVDGVADVFSALERGPDVWSTRRVLQRNFCSVGDSQDVCFLVFSCVSFDVLGK